VWKAREAKKVPGLRQPFDCGSAVQDEIPRVQIVPKLDSITHANPRFVANFPTLFRPLDKERGQVAIFRVG